MGTLFSVVHPYIVQLEMNAALYGYDFVKIFNTVSDTYE